MKFIHISDLHLGKRLYEFSMLEDQVHILNQIIEIIDSEKPNGVLIAGDVYDKQNPPAEAVQLLDDFLVKLAQRKLEVFVISGNHDSPERIAFGSRIMNAGGIHMSPVYNGEITPFTMNDEHGNVNVYMLPFVKPANVRCFCDEDVRENIKTETDAIKAAISKMAINPAERNIIVSHQAIKGAVRSDSEEVVIGNLREIDASAFDPFDYVALGHLHTPQNCGSEKIRYCGTPLKYSLSELKGKKSITVVELLEKGNVQYKTVELTPLRELVELRGTYEELTKKSFYDNTTWQEDYTHIILTDEDDIPDAIGKLRVIYRHLMKLDYDNKRTQSDSEIIGANMIEKKTPLELFEELYELQNNQPMSDEQVEFMKKLIEETVEEMQ